MDGTDDRHSPSSRPGTSGRTEEAGKGEDLRRTRPHSRGSRGSSVGAGTQLSIEKRAELSSRRQGKKKTNFQHVVGGLFWLHQRRPGGGV